MYKITLKSVRKRKNWPVYRIASSRISETTCLYIEFIVLQRAELARVYCIILNLEILHVTWPGQLSSKSSIGKCTLLDSSTPALLSTSNWTVSMWPFSKATRSGVFPSCILRIIINNKSPKCYATGTQFNNSMRRSLISVIVMAKDRATII